MKNKPTSDAAGLHIAASLFSALLSLASTIDASAEIYRWVDADGNRHLSDRAPPRQAYQRVEADDLPLLHITPPPAARPAAAERVPAIQAKKKKPLRKKALDCSRYEKKLAAIKKKLWSGYREPAGNKLRAKRRDYRALLRNCRRNR